MKGGKKQGIGCLQEKWGRLETIEFASIFHYASDAEKQAQNAF